MRLLNAALGIIVTALAAAPAAACPWHVIGGARFSALGPMLDEYRQRSWGPDSPARAASPSSSPEAEIEPVAASDTPTPAASEIGRQPQR